MKVGILGSGDVATTLGSGFITHGHEVMLGTRNAGKLADWTAKQSGAQIGSFPDAARFGEVVVVAVKGSAAAGALRAATAANLEVARRYLAAIEAGAVGDDLAAFFSPDIEQIEFPNRLVPTGARRGRAEMLEGALRGQKVLREPIYV